MKRSIAYCIKVLICASTLCFIGFVVAETGPGTYYKVPSWGQKLPSSNRFLVLSDWNNQAVLDRETGLVWEKTPDATTFSASEYGYYDARGKCLIKTIGGRKGWRLPSIAELMSLADPYVAPPGPTLPPGHPFTNVGRWYWSATKSASNSGYAWGASFYNASQHVVKLSRPCETEYIWDVLTPCSALIPDTNKVVWCVRGPMNEEEY